MKKSRKIVLQSVCFCALLLQCVLVPTAFADLALQSDRRLAQDLPLVPVDPPGFVQLTSCILRAELDCDDARCVLHVEQIYQLHNKDRIKAGTLRIGLPKLQGEDAQLADVSLKDDQGASIPSLGVSPSYQMTWEVNLEADQHKLLTLSYAHPIRSKHFLQWRWDMSRLSAWGIVDGARIAFRLPQFTTDDAFLRVEPGHFAFDGTTLVWEYEHIETSPQHDLIMLSPPTWRRLNDLQAAEAHHELALLYMAIQETARRERVPFPDLFEQIIAELQAAIDLSPQDVPARLDLAQLYRARAEAEPGLHLNYLILAAQELDAALGVDPEDNQVANALSRAYYDAAQTANKMGDPAGALVYLRKAGQVPGTQHDRDRESLGDLSLHWALDLAEKGLVTQALTQLEGVLLPQTEDALLRYAPPLVSVRTEVSLLPKDRIVRHSFRLYPPSASKTWERLQEIAGQLKGTPVCQITLEADPARPDLATLEIRVPYSSVAKLRAQSAVLSGALSEDADLISALVAAPWETELRAYAAEHDPWRYRYVYQERVDLTPVQKVWEMESQYTRWRLIELRSASPGDERAKLEQRLALIALREQRQIWEHLPSSSYWVYRVSFEDRWPSSLTPRPPLPDETSGQGGESSYISTPSQSPSKSWLVGWNQVRDLEFVSSIYRWAPILQALSIILGIALFLVVIAIAWRKFT